MTTAPSGILDRFFATVNIRPGDALLTAAEEIDLGRRLAAGDRSAGDRLATENLRLVAYIAARLKRPGRDLDDRIADGTLGLLRAVEKWDPSRGYRFSTYATWWVKQFIYRGAEDGGFIRVPSYAQQLSRKWSAIVGRLSAELGRAPTDDEVARAAGVSGTKRENVEQARRVEGMHRAEDGHDPKEPRAFRSDLLVLIGDRSAGPVERAERAEADRLTAEDVRARLAGLPPRHAEVIRRRFGLGGPEQTLQQVAAAMGVTRERVRQIEAKAMSRLRSGMGRPPLRALSARIGGPN